MVIRMAHRRARTNPFTRLFADAVERASGHEVLDYRMRDFLKVRRGDIVHLHWFSSLYHGRTKAATYLKSLALELYFLFLKTRGAFIFWTVNNLVSHDADFPELELSITRRLVRHFDGLFAFGEETARKLTEKLDLPSEKVFIVPHGSYSAYYPAGGFSSVRERYGFDAETVYLFFGLLRPYKGLENLIEAFNNEKWNLLIVGGGSSDYAGSLAGMNRSRRTILDVRHVPDEEISSLFESVDRIILPFDSITMSGSMVLALSYGRFVITVADGDVPSYVQDGANGYLMPDNSPKSIRRAAERTDLLPDLERRDWDAKVQFMTDWATIGTRAVDAYMVAAERRVNAQ